MKRWSKRRKWIFTTKYFNNLHFYQDLKEEVKEDHKDEEKPEDLQVRFL